jgi:isopentenyl phosphate kinase
MESPYKHIIKIGGSVLTGHGNKPSIDLKNTLRLCSELKPHYQTCLLIHGTGNYGKPPAIKYGYYKSGLIDSTNSAIALEIKKSLQKLNLKFVDKLHCEGIPAKGILLDRFYDNQNQLIDEDKLLEILSIEFDSTMLPVLYGDLIELPDGSFQVISSDDIVSTLTKMLKPKSTIFLSNVDGVFLAGKASKNGNRYLTPVLNAINVSQIDISPKDSYDVSGGMSKKVAIALEAARYCNQCFIGNGFTAGLLHNLLNNKKVKGTDIN